MRAATYPGARDLDDRCECPITDEGVVDEYRGSTPDYVGLGQQVRQRDFCIAPEVVPKYLGLGAQSSRGKSWSGTQRERRTADSIALVSPHAATSSFGALASISSADPTAAEPFQGAVDVDPYRAFDVRVIAASREPIRRDRPAGAHIHLTHRRFDDVGQFA